jgi:hypothetical protein
MERFFFFDTSGTRTSLDAINKLGEMSDKFCEVSEKFCEMS